MVFVVQDVKDRDYSPAMKHGQLTLLLPPGNITLSTQPTVRRLKKALKDFNDEDFLLLSGDPVAIGLACAIASDANQGRVKLLKWENRASEYYCLEANMRREFTDE